MLVTDLQSLTHILLTTTCGSHMWNTWWNKLDFRITCSRLGHDNIGIDTDVRWEADCLVSFRENACNEWLKDVNRIEAKRGNGLNKLRTYAIYKREFKLEPYLTCIEDRSNYFPFPVFYGKPVVSLK